MKPGLQLRLHQQLTLTPQLQQAIRLLQLSRLELETELRELAESNPLLELDGEGVDESEPETADGAAAEAAAPVANTTDNVEFGEMRGDGAGQDDRGANERRDERGDDRGDDRGTDAWDGEEFGATSYGNGANHDDDDGFEAQDAAPVSLHEHLLHQVNLLNLSPRDRAIALALIDAVDEDGYLREGLASVQAALREPTVGLDEIEAVRHRLQQLDPSGVASLDLRECLSAQLRGLAPDTEHLHLAQAMIAEHLEALAKRDFARIARSLQAPPEAVAEAAALIRTLDPRPGAALGAAPVEYVAPDAYVLREQGRWRVRLAAGNQPKLGLNRHYCGLIARARREDAAYLKGQLQEARWLIKSLQARADTLLRVAEAIVRQQSAFLDFGPEAMRPLVLREIAEESACTNPPSRG
ncbi:RNA polymerase sigma factor 54 [mine drainage metagenome]|uniref:RNA polymerase sigma factor 54 n=1 Tax=mine drainage metagenome TaxID=410659 RepID=T1C9Q5_9ZZZZ